MAPEELSESSLLAALDGARIVYFDVRLHETALVIARKRLKSLPKLPPQLLRLDAVGCDSMEPLSETQLWNMVSSLDHKYCHQVKYENTLSSTLRSEIPSWFPNKDYIPSDVYRSKYELIVDIPQHIFGTNDAYSKEEIDLVRNLLAGHLLHHIDN